MGDRNRRGLSVAAAASFLLALAPAQAEVITDGASRWSIEVDRGEEDDGPLRDMIARSGAPVIFRALFLEISRDHPGRRATLAEKRQLVDRWQQLVVNQLENEDYEQWSTAELQERSGLSLAEFRQKLLESQPFGLRDKMPVLADDVYFLMNATSLSCTRRDGGFAAFVTGMYPSPDLANDYGGIMLILLGAGDCAGAAADRYLDRTREDSASLLVERIQLEP